MKPSILSVLRKQTKLIKFLVFLITFSQVYGQGYAFYLNKDSVPSRNVNIAPTTAAEKNPLIHQDSKNTNSGNIVKEAAFSNKEIKISTPKVSTAEVLAKLNASTLEKYTSKTRFYISDIKEGIIGKDKEHPIDQVYDNIFKVNIKEDVKSVSNAYLEYELFGVKDFSGISKSINDDLAKGGASVVKNSEWVLQSEPINISSLMSGENVILFTIPSNADYVYKVRNLRIRLDNNKSENKNIATETINPNAVFKDFTLEKQEELTSLSATLSVSEKALKENKRFSITPLRDIDIPALSPEMVNVTSQSSGYRFLPHGEHFSIPAKVSIGYDKAKIPEGYTEQDIKTFYFDKNQKKWIALEKDSLVSQKQIIVSNTTHFTDMINGVIKVPESPETGSYAPNSIKDIKAADPSAGIVNIAPPTPNNMGTVNTAFPIKLPAGRNGMQPSLSVNYNSEGGNGWMGVGWDLTIPAISIDTRWGGAYIRPNI